MSFPVIARDGEYYYSPSGVLYKCNLTDNRWDKVINIDGEVQDQVDFDIRKKALSGIERNFASNHKIETEDGLEYDIEEESFRFSWIADGSTSTFNFTNETIPQTSGIPNDNASVYVYVNDKIYAKFYKGVNDATYDFDATRVLITGGNSLVFANAVGNANAEWANYGCQSKTNAVIRLEYYPEVYQEDTGITQYVEFEDGIDGSAIATQYYPKVELPSGSYSPYKDECFHSSIVVMSGYSGDSGEFFQHVEPNTYNSVASIQPCVIKDESTYKMWFIGDDSGGIKRLLYSESSDCINWSTPVFCKDPAGTYPGLVNYEGTYDTDDVYSPFIIKEGNKYKIWYSANSSGNLRILYSESNDGIIWEFPKLVINLGPSGGTYDYQVLAPCVLWDKDHYKMWFSGNDGSGSIKTHFTTSKDGIIWETPILASMERSASLWDSTRDSYFSVIKDGDLFKGIYSGEIGSITRVLYTVSIDGINWSDGVPLFDDKIDTEPKYIDTTNSDILYPFFMKDENIYRIFFTARKEFSSNYRIFYTELHPVEKEVCSISNIQKNRNYEAEKKAICVLSGDTGDDTGNEWYYHSTAYNNWIVSRPIVVKDGSTYVMYFSGHDSTNIRILRTTSADGIVWGTPTLAININEEPNNYDDDHIYSEGNVIKDGDTWKIWYNGYTSPDYKFLYRTSTDGITWSTPVAINSLDGTKPGLTNYNGTFDTNNVYSPFVIKDGNKYKIWYVGLDGSSKKRILYSESYDGIRWETPILAIDIGKPGSINSAFNEGPHVIKDGNIYRMWYHVNDPSSNYKIFYSTSANGINWEKPTTFLDKVSLLNETTFPQEYSKTTRPYVIKDGNKYKMWFSVQDSTSQRICYTEFTEKEISLYYDKDSEQINLYKTRNDVLQSGISDNLFDDQDFESQTNGIAIGGDWTSGGPDGFIGSNANVNSGALCALPAAANAGNFIYQNVSGLDITKNYVLSAIVYYIGTLTSSDLEVIFDDAGTTGMAADVYHEIEGAYNFWYVEYRGKPGSTSNNYGFKVVDNLQLPIDNVHFGLDSYQLTEEDSKKSKELINNIPALDSEYNCLIETVVNAGNYDVTAIVNDVEISGSLAIDDETSLQKISFFGEKLKGVRGTFDINDIKLKFGTEKTLWTLFQFIQKDKDIRAFSDNGRIYGIVESGANDNGSWIKYEDGSLIQFGKAELEYEAANSIGLDPFLLPIDYINNKWVFIFGSIDDHENLDSAELNGGGMKRAFNKTNYSCRLIVYGTGTFDSGDIAIYDWMTIGRWK